MRPFLTAIRPGAAVLVLLAALPSAHAQVRPDAGSTLGTTRDAPATPRATPPVLPTFEPKPAIPGNTALMVKVGGFRLAGNTVYADAVLLDLLTEYIGRDLDLKGLYEAADKIRSYYRGNGYFLAQAYLPVQELPKGQSATVEITIIEGRIGKVTPKVAPDSRFRESFIKGILDAGMHEGDLITETGLERPLLLLNDLAGAAVQSTIKPSAHVGAADLDVDVTRTPMFTGSVDFDNHGNRFTGEYRLGATVNVNNISGFGDQLTMRGQMTDQHSTSQYRVGYTLPVWHYGTKVGINYANVRYGLGKTEFAALQATGHAQVSNFVVLHPFIRSRNLNVIGQANYEVKALQDTTNSTNRVEDRNVKAGRYGVIGDFRDRVFGGGLNSFAAVYTAGVLNIPNDTLRNTDQTPGTGANTAGGFHKLNLDYQRLQYIAENLNLLYSISIQHSFKNLTSAEKISLGGPSGVRAYPVSEALGDRGFYSTIEARYALPGFKLMQGDVALSAFYDWGHVKTNHANPSNFTGASVRNLAGAGFGASVGKADNFLIRASLAWRVEREKAVSDGADRNPRLWLQALKWF